MLDLILRRGLRSWPWVRPPTPSRVVDHLRVNALYGKKRQTPVQPTGRSDTKTAIGVSLNRSKRQFDRC